MSPWGNHQIGRWSKLNSPSPVFEQPLESYCIMTPILVREETVPVAGCWVQVSWRWIATWTSLSLYGDSSSLLFALQVCLSHLLLFFILWRFLNEDFISIIGVLWKSRMFKAKVSQACFHVPGQVYFILTETGHRSMWKQVLFSICLLGTQCSCCWGQPSSQRRHNGRTCFI